MTSRVKFVDSHSFSRGAEHTHCSLCSGGYSKWTYQYAKVVEGPAKGVIVCPECLKARDFSARAEVMADRYEQLGAQYTFQANLLRQAEKWDVPTYQEWRRREDAAANDNPADRDYVPDLVVEVTGDGGVHIVSQGVVQTKAEKARAEAESEIPF